MGFLIFRYAHTHSRIVFQIIVVILCNIVTSMCLASPAWKDDQINMCQQHVNCLVCFFEHFLCLLILNLRPSIFFEWNTLQHKFRFKFKTGLLLFRSSSIQITRTFNIAAFSCMHIYNYALPQTKSSRKSLSHSSAVEPGV